MSRKLPSSFLGGGLPFVRLLLACPGLMRKAKMSCTTDKKDTNRDTVANDTKKQLRNAGKGCHKKCDAQRKIS